MKPFEYIAANAHSFLHAPTRGGDFQRLNNDCLGHLKHWLAGLSSESSI